MVPGRAGGVRPNPSEMPCVLDRSLPKDCPREDVTRNCSPRSPLGQLLGPPSRKGRVARVELIWPPPWRCARARKEAARGGRWACANLSVEALMDAVHQHFHQQAVGLRGWRGTAHLRRPIFPRQHEALCGERCLPLPAPGPETGARQTRPGPARIRLDKGPGRRFPWPEPWAGSPLQAHYEHYIA